LEGRRHRYEGEIRERQKWGMGWLYCGQTKGRKRVRDKIQNKSFHVKFQRAVQANIDQRKESRRKMKYLLIHNDHSCFQIHV
jgi:hypothetical protein